MARSAATNRVIIPQIQNLMKYSSDMANASGWSAVGTTLTANDIEAPDDLQRALIATRITETSTLDVHYDYHFPQGTVAFRKASLYTASCYYKAGTRTFGGMYLDLGASNIIFLLNLTTGAVTTSSSTNQAHIVSTSVTNAGNGWWRAAITFYLDVAASQFIAFAASSSNGTSIFYLGDNTRYFYAICPQLVQGNMPGPPTLTTSATVNTGPMRNKAVSRTATSNRITP